MGRKRMARRQPMTSLSQSQPSQDSHPIQAPTPSQTSQQVPNTNPSQNTHPVQAPTLSQTSQQIPNTNPSQNTYPIQAPTLSQTPQQIPNTNPSQNTDPIQAPNPSHDTNPAAPTLNQTEIPRPPTSRNAKKCATCWTIDIIDENGVIKEERLKIRDVWNLPTGQRIVVPFNNHGQAVGEASGLLGGFIGIVGTNLTSFPIS